MAAAAGNTAEPDTIYVLGEHVLVISSAPAFWSGAEVGAVVTLRDRTELQTVSGELDLVRGLTESLRAQNHEAANRLHAVVSLMEMGRPESAVEFATDELRVAQDMTGRIPRVGRRTVLAALLLGKTAQAAERGVDLTIEGAMTEDHLEVAPRDQVRVVGNLVDNAFDAVSDAAERRVSVKLGGDAHGIRIVVGDSGAGIPPEDAERVLERGWSTKASDGRGLGLALVGQVSRRHSGTLAVGDSPLGGAQFTVTLGTTTPGTTTPGRPTEGEPE